MNKKLILSLAPLCFLSYAQYSLANTNSTNEHVWQIKNNQFWWPDQIDLSSLRDQDPRSNPYGENFNYANEFKKLDLEAIKKDINVLLTQSQDWWPADYGNYGPLFIRMAWHNAGTYRELDGRGGVAGAQQRFDPINSWPDNASLDKARRLLWPIKQKYGRKISWGDLIVLTGTVSLENMGFQTLGFAGGRPDDWEPEFLYWGPETEMFKSDRKDINGKLKGPLSSTHMGLIYVNPEGPYGEPDPVGSAKNVRQTFNRMSMNDEETVALVAGGHTFGKMHGAVKHDECIGVEPAISPLQNQGLGWENKCGKGNAEDTWTSGLEGAWTQSPTHWSMLYLNNLLNTEWVSTKSAGGAYIWVPKNSTPQVATPDAHIKNKMNTIVMNDADIAIKEDPIYRKIAEDFLANPDKFKQVFAQAWFKLTHRDLGPNTLYLGSDVPKQEFIWQDPVPSRSYTLVDSDDITELKRLILDTDLTISDLVSLAWESASTYRNSDHRGGTNGARIRLEPEINWAVNNPKKLKHDLNVLTKVQKKFNDNSHHHISMADLIVLGGDTAIEQAAANAGYAVTVPFKPGRGDALQNMTDIESISLLEPKADAFRNYYDPIRNKVSSVDMMVDKADQLNLTVPEMVVLIGGMRVLDTNSYNSQNGVLTTHPSQLDNEYFVNLLSMSNKWEEDPEQRGVFIGLDRKTNKVKWTATSVDLVLGANPELRAVAEAYGSNDANKMFVDQFIQAWFKVMNLGRYNISA